MSEIKTPPSRDLKIDIMKGLFVVGLVWGHVAGYTGTRANTHVDTVWNVLAVALFSGFIFCMGYIMQITYFAQEKPPVAKMLRSTVRTMVGYYIAAIGFFVIFRGEFDPQTIISVLLLQKFGSISEFLIAFALIPLVTIILTTPLKKYILPSDRAIFITIFLLVMTTFLPTSWVKSPYLAFFIGGPPNAIFYPVLPYYTFFLLGAYYASRNIKVGTRHLLVSILALGIYVGSMRLGIMYSRFPPSFAWIVLGSAIIFLWYWVSERLALWRPAAKIFAPIGANSLFYFVLSDIFIFAVAKTFKGNVTVLGGTVLAFIILAAIYSLMVFVRPVKVQK
jgi:hypothetical protein